MPAIEYGKVMHPRGKLEQRMKASGEQARNRTGKAGGAAEDGAEK